MKFFTIFIKNNKTTYGGEQTLRHVVLFFFVPYDYDAWGNVTVMDSYGNTNTNSYFIGNINPFRYRGYYYDVETGFYYLQTRYYDPTICRFINADNYELVAQLSCVPGQLNMYAYCGNNPIMLTDETGEGILTMMLIGALIGGVLSAGIDVTNQIYESGTVDLRQTGLSFLGGALGGAVAASPLGIWWQVGINAGIGVLLNVAEQTSSGQGFNVLSMVNDGLTEVLVGGFGGKGVYNVGKTAEGVFEYRQLTISNVKAIAEFNKALKNSTFTSVAVLIFKKLLGA